jgi:hypothetical protein
MFGFKDKPSYKRSEPDYLVACPRGIVASTSWIDTMLASPCRLSAWDGGQVQRQRSHHSTPASGQWWRVPLVGFPWDGLVWLRLLPHAIKLRGSNKLQTNKYNRQNG